MGAARWNSNLQAFEVLLGRIPSGTTHGLDVGCGEGETSRRLRLRVPTVVGIDVDEPSIDAARACGDDIEYRVVDVLTEDLGDGGFDVVTAVATVHHLDHRAAFERLGQLVAPGGLVLVVGLARSGATDLPRDAFDSIALRRHSWTKGVWETPSPKVWPPPLTYREVRDLSAKVLPGSRFERLPYLRYGLTWTRPEA